MKRKIYYFMIFLIALSFGYLNISPVFAEESFANEECITDNTWTKTAKTDYRIDEENKMFITSGITAEQYIAQQNLEPKYIYYDVSEDGKTLTAYIDNYQGIIKTEELKKVIEDAGITVTATCDHVLKVSKTFEDDANNSNDQAITDDQNNSTGTDDLNTIEKIESPNTASPASLLAVSLGAVLVVASVYVILNRNNKNTINNK